MKWIGKKLAAMAVTLLLVSIFTFFAFEVIAGNSMVSKMGMDASKEQIAALEEEYGLNKSMPERYGDWIAHAVQGDFGISYQYNLPVTELVSERMQVTVGLGLMAIVLILVISIPLGLFAARHEGRFWDNVIITVNQVFMSVPHFFLGMLICLIFGMILHWFIPGAYVPISESVTGYLGYMIFPAAAIAIPKISMVVKFLRTSVVRQMKMDYVRTARGKGSSERRILYHHVLKNALIPVITFLAMIIAEVLAGSFVIEPVFGLPGLGRLLVASISTRDYPVVQVIVLYIATLVVVLNGIVDILYQVFDPRVKETV
ncbi:ABC transporter permease [[Clostridium] polysaccharolyticum]|uniref:Peptide/nickel transport system permease protein n=1 Tax=[Clostridium] polysaccharolyticum TaxID=29364 RepID=A0A1H9ZA88_9FIRM|nr:ABC transporter permease [[Clostridium] polysaccharolyticum]SES78526.1 peptide/nickel transport system permease protein [[Clostridium] polysaccharolyticum]